VLTMRPNTHTQCQPTTVHISTHHRTHHFLPPLPCPPLTPTTEAWRSGNREVPTPPPTLLLPLEMEVGAAAVVVVVVEEEEEKEEVVAEEEGKQYHNNSSSSSGRKRPSPSSRSHPSPSLVKQCGT
jgi:hypothetical protein